ncbi:hypothetical protein IAU59_001577 [Kwoniella sp. CBS 9459]
MSSSSSSPATPSPTSVTATKVNATGASVISGLTLIAASYLFYSLVKQGRGKLRVRLLLGMVVSDLAIGLVAMPPEIMYLAGAGLKTGTRSCDAIGFLLTAVLFSQHLWTLAIAVATFLLLIYPLSPATSFIERYSWVSVPLIWGISILHSGIWHATVGWTSSGILCYYGTQGTGLDRDLMQFIPRAFVFVTICILYTRLFRFLRRPDTIQLSTQFMAGTQTDPNGERGFGQGLHSQPQAPKSKSFLARLGRAGSAGHKEPVNPDAPWEALEFVQIGGINPLMSHTSPQLNALGVAEFTPNVPNGILLASRPVSPELISPMQEVKDPFSSATGTVAGSSRTRKPSVSSDASGPSSQRPSATDTLVTPELNYQVEVPSSIDSTTRLVTPDTIPTIQRQHVLSPVLSQGSKLDLEGNSLSSRTGVEDAGEGDDEFDQEGQGGPRRASGQTLKEFFQEYQVTGLDELQGRERGSGSASRGLPQMSAAAYFNRQASLLMLYFPLAYMVVFSVSLVRLVYDMVHGSPNSVLSIMSSWFVLSVGLIDGLVYGIAELMVKAKVRRKMPEHI